MRYVTYLGYPVVVRPLVCSELPICRLLERRNAPCLRRICRVRPHPFIRPEYLVVVLERPGASKCPRVMHTTGVTQRVIDNQQILRQADDLKSVLRQHLMPDSERTVYIPDSR